MALVILQHHADDAPAVLGDVLRDHGHRPRVVRLFAGQSVPPDLDDVDGVVSLGGPMNLDETGQHPWMAQEMAFLKEAHEATKPMVGVCLGAQLIAAALGGTVAAMPQPEVGWHNVKLAFPGTVDTIYQGIPWDTVQMHMHAQEVTQLPPSSTPLAGSKLCKNQAFKVGLTTYAFQYHFEWTRDDIRQAAQHELTRRAGSTPEAVVGGLDGYYDSYRRLGDRLCETMALMLFPIDRRRG